MYKRFFTIILIITILLSSFTIAHGVGPALEIRVNSSNVLVGEEIEVQIVTKNIIDIAGADIILNYDENKLQYVSKTINISSEDYIDIQSESSNLNDGQNEVRIMFGLKEGATLISGGEVVLATINFTAIDVGMTSLTLNSFSTLVKSDGDRYIYENVVIDGQSTDISISKKGSVAGVITLSDEESPESEIVELWKDGINLESTYINTDGTYSFTGLEDGDYIIKISIKGYESEEVSVNISNGEGKVMDIIINRIKEDADRSGGIGLSDLVFVGNKYGLVEGETGFNKDADVNSDGKIDILDLIYITRKIQ